MSAPLPRSAYLLGREAVRTIVVTTIGVPMLARCNALLCTNDASRTQPNSCARSPCPKHRTECQIRPITLAQAARRVTHTTAAASGQASMIPALLLLLRAWAGCGCGLRAAGCWMLRAAGPKLQSSLHALLRGGASQKSTRPAAASGSGGLTPEPHQRCCSGQSRSLTSRNSYSSTPVDDSKKTRNRMRDISASTAAAKAAPAPAG